VSAIIAKDNFERHFESAHSFMENNFFQYRHHRIALPGVSGIAHTPFAPFLPFLIRRL
jgi:hypothetical protein